MGYGYGFLSYRNRLPPQPLIQQAYKGWLALRGRIEGDLPWYYVPTAETRAVVSARPEAVAPGLIAIGGLSADGHNFARIIDSAGNVIDEWSIDWFDRWADATHLDEETAPKSGPATFLHGMVLMEDGGIVFNYDGLGMMRLDAAGETVWRLPYRTHHAMFRDDEGNIWAPGQKTHRERNPKWPLYEPPFEEYTILRVSPEGAILEEVSLFDVLWKNDLQGLLYLASRDGWKPEMSGDTLHLNDVEMFPRDMKPGVFKPGDIMVSLRNINAVLVFEPETWKAKYVSVGHFIRQHDPDFIDGNTISVFDNNNLGDMGSGVQSRIVVEDVATCASRVAFAGSAELPFYTDILGKHQWLPNGNLLMLEARAGRVFELDRDGHVVWQYNNIAKPGLLGALSDMMKLPADITAAKLVALREQCVARKAGASTAAAVSRR